MRGALKAGLLATEEYTILLECISDRNLTSHTYKAAFAQELEENTSLL